MKINQATQFDNRHAGAALGKSGQKTNTWTRQLPTEGNGTAKPANTAATSAKDKIVIPLPGWSAPKPEYANQADAPWHSRLTPNMETVQAITTEAAMNGGFQGHVQNLLLNSAANGGDAVWLREGSHQYETTPTGALESHFTAIHNHQTYHVYLQQTPTGAPFVSRVSWKIPGVDQPQFQVRQSFPPAY